MHHLTVCWILGVVPKISFVGLIGGPGLDWIGSLLLACFSMVMFSVWHVCIAMHGIFSKQQE
jgi:hypothetical protein